MSFRAALNHVTAMHDLEVAALRAENSRLRALLQGDLADREALPPMGPRFQPSTKALLVEGEPSEEEPTLYDGTAKTKEDNHWSDDALEVARPKRSASRRITKKDTLSVKELKFQSERSQGPQKPKGAFLSAVVEAARAETYAAPHHTEQGPLCQRLCQQSLLVFESTMGVIVLLNTILIGVSCDVPWEGWIWVDVLFMVIFVIEVLFKIAVYGARDWATGVEARWHFFEAFLVLLALTEILLTVTISKFQEGANLMSLARIVRLVRITRIIRLARLEIFCDLVVMIRGTLGGMRTLLWSTVVIAIPLYAIALFLRETLGNIEETGFGAESFKTLPRSFFTLFRCVVAADCNDDVEGIPIFPVVANRYGWGYGLLYCLTMVFMSFGLFNVIVAIFVENVMAAAKTNDQLLKKQRLRDQVYLADKMVELLMVVWDAYQVESGTDSVHNIDKMPLEDLVEIAAPMEIDRSLFEKLRQNDKVKDIFHDLDVAEEDQYKLFDTLDVDGSGTIDVEELCEGISKLRGDARRSDIVQMNLQIRHVQQAVHALAFNLIPPSGDTTPRSGTPRATTPRTHTPR